MHNAIRLSDICNTMCPNVCLKRFLKHASSMQMKVSKDIIACSSYYSI